MDVKKKLLAILRPLYGKDAVRMECFKCKRHGSECPECSIEYAADYLIDNGVTIKENAVIIETPPVPTVDEVKKAARVIRAFCNSRNSDPETDCIECPIRDMCSSDPYTWEV